MLRQPPTSDISDSFWDPDHPYRIRTWFRSHMPGPLSSLFPKGEDCESKGGWHRWYNQDGAHSGCYHCTVVAEGKLWRQQVLPPASQA